MYNGGWGNDYVLGAAIMKGFWVSNLLEDAGGWGVGGGGGGVSCGVRRCVCVRTFVSNLLEDAGRWACVY